MARDISLRGSSIEAFAASLRGDVLLQGNPDYDADARVWNGMFDRQPALIACCTGASDVRHAVDFAREHRLLTAVRAGGHSVSGKSTCDGGLVIDLQQMQGVRVDPELRARLSSKPARCWASSTTNARRSGSRPRPARSRTPAPPG